MELLTRKTLEVIERFNRAFNLHNVRGMMVEMSADCVFENTFPPPDGQVIRGQEEVELFWKVFFQKAPHARLDFEEIFACSERGVVRWVYRWGQSGDDRDHVRGVDVFRLINGKIAEKLSYVKG